MKVTREDELAEALAGAASPLTIRGGGTRGPGGAQRGEALEVALCGITLYEPGALTLRAWAGTPLSEIRAAVAAEGQRLPFEPGDWGAALGRAGDSTIGGVVAANVSGPRRIQAGACRDSLIGVRFVDGRGDVIRNGGRVMKNVTGLDLVKLMAGSWGTLGVLSEVTFKLLPAAPAQATLCLDLPIEAAQPVLAEALGTPYDVTGAGWLPGPGVVLRLEGLAASVSERAAALAARLARFGPVWHLEDGAATPWADLADLTPFKGRPGDLWRLSIRPTEAGRVLARLGLSGRPGDCLLDWGGGLMWVLVPEGTDLRARAAPYTGHALCLRGAPAQVFEPQPAPLARLQEALRRQFDPRGILNPGRMG